jgi:DNA-binding ferritin-like protein
MKGNPTKRMSTFDVSVKYSKTSSIKTKQIHFRFCGQAFIQIH